MKIISVIITLVVFSTFAKADDVAIRFGKIEIIERIGEHGMRFGFVKEMDRVPILSMKDGGLYGLEYSSSQDTEYTVQVSATLPAGIKVQGGDIMYINENEQFTIVIFNPRKITGAQVEPFLFTEDDPEGIYALSVALNGKPYKVITYEAYKPNAH